MLDNKILQKKTIRTETVIYLPDAYKVYSIKINRSMVHVKSVSLTEHFQFLADDARYRNSLKKTAYQTDIQTKKKTYQAYQVE